MNARRMGQTDRTDGWDRRKRRVFWRLNCGFCGAVAGLCEGDLDGFVYLYVVDWSPATCGRLYNAERPSGCRLHNAQSLHFLHSIPAPPRYLTRRSLQFFSSFSTTLKFSQLLRQKKSGKVRRPGSGSKRSCRGRASLRAT
eukprot:scaffold4937_cov261-Pinguiococcus_pyrenoidosus.AAC.1